MEIFGIPLQALLGQLLLGLRLVTRIGEPPGVARLVVRAVVHGLSVLLSVWYSRASRAHMASYDIMFGAAAADTTQAEVLITA